MLVSGLFYDLLSTTRLGNSALEERKKRTKEGPAWSSSGQRRRILASAPSEVMLLSPLRGRSGPAFAAPGSPRRPEGGTQRPAPTLQSCRGALPDGPLPHLALAPGLGAEGLVLQVLEIKLTTRKLKWQLKGRAPRSRGPGLHSVRWGAAPRLPPSAQHGDGRGPGWAGGTPGPSDPLPSRRSLVSIVSKVPTSTRFLKFVSGIIFTNVSRTKKS